MVVTPQHIIIKLENARSSLQQQLDRQALKNIALEERLSENREQIHRLQGAINFADEAIKLAKESQNNEST